MYVPVPTLADSPITAVFYIGVQFRMKENVSLSEKTVLCTHIPARDYKCYI